MAGRKSGPAFVIDAPAGYTTGLICTVTMLRGKRNLSSCLCHSRKTTSLLPAVLPLVGAAASTPGVAASEPATNASSGNTRSYDSPFHNEPAPAESLPPTGAVAPAAPAIRRSKMLQRRTLRVVATGVDAVAAAAAAGAVAPFVPLGGAATITSTCLLDCSTDAAAGMATACAFGPPTAASPGDGITGVAAALVASAAGGSMSTRGSVSAASAARP